MNPTPSLTSASTREGLARTPILAALVLGLGLAPCATGAAPADTAPAPQNGGAALVQRAQASFEQATALVRTDSEGARALYQQAGAEFQAAIVQTPARNPRLFTNAGNAWFLADDLGQAVASYRSALLLDPDYDPARRGLAAARAKVSTSPQAGSARELLDTLSQWPAVIPRGVVLGAALALHAGAWLAAAARRLGRPAPAAAGIWMGVLALALIGMLALDARRLATPAGVIRTQVVGRAGPDASVYEPSFNQPLTAGLEFTRRETRDGWWRITLADGRETWIPAGAAISIDHMARGG